jgi:hypothetical protein
MWRLCYAHLVTKTLSIKELEAVSWYLWLISEKPQLTRYCEDNGFEEINIVLKRFKKIWDESEPTDPPSGKSSTPSK